MADYTLALPILKSFEGNYSNDPDDKGGETYSGVSRNNFPNWTGWARVDLLKHQLNFPHNLVDDSILNILVSEFYKKEFWDKNHLTEVVIQEVAIEIFEMAVNFGSRPAIRIVQQALNLLNKAGLIYNNIFTDGFMGTETLIPLNSFSSKPAPLIKTINGLQFARYVEICEKNESQEKYFYGWLTRT